MSKEILLKISPRDLELFEFLDCNPLTVKQILKLSSTFRSYRFKDPHDLRKRLRKLEYARYLKSWPYLTKAVGRSELYYRLTRKSYLHLHGSDVTLPNPRYFREISDGHHQHTQGLGDFISHLFYWGWFCGNRVHHYQRENSVKISTGAGYPLYPDGMFSVATGERKYNFVLELDRGTERIRSQHQDESLQKKILGYDSHQQKLEAFDPSRYVVLFVTTKSQTRVDHILQACSELMKKPNRSLFYGTTFQQFLAANPFSDSVFVDNTGKSRSFLPSKNLGNFRQRLLAAEPLPC